ncbi:hypothetical protein ABMX48_29595 [Streptomyces cavourensis]
MKTAAEDTEYRALLGHTISCPTCRADNPCPTAARLRAAVRQARRH